ncbi:MAG: MBL fold metallo-hydrolase [Ginsengibacter sp.]
MLKIQIFVFSPVQENTYVVYNDEKDCLIIDPGCYYPDEKEKIKSFITENRLHPVMLLNTHCHLDHVFGNKFIADNYGLTLQLHPDEKKLLDMAPASGLMFDLPFDNYQGDFIFLNEGDKIRLGNDELEVIHVPGHSPGSICFYCRQQHFVIGGDTLFNGSVGRTDLPGGDHDTLIQNIQRKLLSLPGEVKVYSGHGPFTTIGLEKKSNPFVGDLI